MKEKRSELIKELLVKTKKEGNTKYFDLLADKSVKHLAKLLKVVNILP